MMLHLQGDGAESGVVDANNSQIVGEGRTAPFKLLGEAGHFRAAKREGRVRGRRTGAAQHRAETEGGWAGGCVREGFDQEAPG